MTGEQRRIQIIHIIKHTTKPVPAKDLAAEFSVSRQVIVQDVALIRAQGYDILSTNRGYLLLDKNKASRIIKVSHSDEQMRDELETIVDLGVTVDNVMVNHRVYGHIEAPLHISSRRDITKFIETLHGSKSTPLKNTTAGYHYHTISADSEETLDEVEEQLLYKGYLIKKI